MKIKKHYILSLNLTNKINKQLKRAKERHGHRARNVRRNQQITASSSLSRVRERQTRSVRGGSRATTTSDGRTSVLRASGGTEHAHETRDRALQPAARRRARLDARAHARPSRRDRHLEDVRERLRLVSRAPRA